MQSHPYGKVQFEAHKQQLMRVQREIQGLDVISGYSSDSRPSVIADQDFDHLGWEDHARYMHLVQRHQKHTNDVDGVVRKTRKCPNEFCGKHILLMDVEKHKRECPYRECVRCPYLDCVTYWDVDEIDRHKATCLFKQTKECDWCFKQVRVHFLLCFAATDLQHKPGTLLYIVDFFSKQPTSQWPPPRHGLIGLGYSVCICRMQCV